MPKTDKTNLRDFFHDRGEYPESARRKIEPARSPFDGVLKMVKACFKDWPTFIGTLVQGVNLVVLIHKIAGLSLSGAMLFLYDAYLSFLRDKIFVVFAWMGFAINDYWMIIITLWMTFGVIYTRAWIKLHEMKAWEMDRKLNDPVWMGEYRKMYGNERADDYIKFLEKSRKEIKPTPRFAIQSYLVGILFFPFFAPLVERKDFIVDDRWWDEEIYFNQRTYIALQTLMVVGWASLFALL